MPSGPMAETVSPIRLEVTAGGEDGALQGDVFKKPMFGSRGSLLGQPKSPEANESMQSAPRPLSTGKGYPSKYIPVFASSQTNARTSTGDGKRDSQAIDPLSHAILQRTTVSNLQASKTMTALAPEEEKGTSDTAPTSSSRPSLDPQAIRNDSVFTSNSKDKRNRASFFSKFVASKKKDALIEIQGNETAAGDKRAEGMNAAVFSRPIGYVPQFPSPPKYIKVRSHGKKEKDFDRVFLAQELRGRTGVEIAQAGGRPLKNGGTKTDSRKDGDAVWAMEFSTDGKHLAAGGKDNIVRVWAVLSNKQDRQAHEAQEDTASQKGGQNMRLNAPVFKKRTIQEYSGHTASILDLSWSKNNFLLSSSMDKTVRLWHISKEECLCCFKHTDFVTSIQFHPRDDRFFLAGSLDSKLRLWSIPDKGVAYWNALPAFITAVAFSPDGKTAIAGLLNGLCLFYDTETLKYQTQVHVRSAHGKNAKGSKITGIQSINSPPDDPHGEVKVLISSNDSRVRVYNLRDKGLEIKLKGNENACSQIQATFSDDGKYIICGSEDRKAYIWSANPAEVEKDKIPVEMFEAHQAIVTAAIMAPTRTKQLLSASGDPLYDLCNPPPVTLVSRTHSRTSFPATAEVEQPSPSIASQIPDTPDFSQTTKPEESPAYLARCSHPKGNIIVTADYCGNIKVFRQDCAYTNRIRNNESNLTKKMLGRTNSVSTKNSTRSSRNSLQLNPSTDRILSWRQSINNATSSSSSFRHNSSTSTHPPRSISPRKSLGRASLQSMARHHSQQNTPTIPTGSPSPPHPLTMDSKAPNSTTTAATSSPKAQAPPAKCDKDSNPLMLKGDQSYMFWNSSVYQAQADNANRYLDPKYGYASTAGSSNVSISGTRDSTHLAPIGRETTRVSRLSSEETSEADGDGSQGGSGRGEGRKARWLVECAPDEL